MKEIYDGIRAKVDVEKNKESQQKNEKPIRKCFFEYEGISGLGKRALIGGLQNKNVQSDVKNGYLKRKVQRFIINLIIWQKLEMQSKFKVKTKYSYSPGKFNESIFQVRARITKKTAVVQQVQIREHLIESNRTSSLTPHKNRHNAIHLFKQAHKIDSAQTFLVSDKAYRLSKTNQSSTPHSDQNRQCHLMQPIHCSNNLRSMSSSRVHDGGQRHGDKVIQRTVSIVIEGQNQETHNQQDLMTTLSKLILGEERVKDDFYIEFLDESSIHGEQDIFVEMDSKFLKDSLMGQQTSLRE